jgi:molybdate transport system permease protein
VTSPPDSASRDSAPPDPAPRDPAEEVRADPGRRARPSRAAASRSPRDRRLPVLVLVPALVGLALLVLPAVALLVRAPWSTLGARLASETVLDALRVSLPSSPLRPSR